MLGLGIALAMVFPTTVNSQTITSYDEAKITNPSRVYSTPSPETVQEALATTRANSAIPQFCSCVTFVKGLTGLQETVGAARNWPINSKIPTVGGVVVLNESKFGHVAYITAVSQNSFTVVEDNYVPCAKSTRTLLLTDPGILGYWKG